MPPGLWKGTLLRLWTNHTSLVLVTGTSLQVCLMKKHMSPGPQIASYIKDFSSSCLWWSKAPNLSSANCPKRMSWLNEIETPVSAILSSSCFPSCLRGLYDFISFPRCCSVPNRLGQVQGCEGTTGKPRSLHLETQPGVFVHGCWGRRALLLWGNIPSLSPMSLN